MSTSQQTEKFCEEDDHFQKVLAGQVSTYDFFTQSIYADSKNAFMELYQAEFKRNPVGSLYTHST